MTQTSAEDTQVLVPVLTGLRLVDMADKLAPGIESRTGVEVDVAGLPAQQGLEDRLKPFIGAPLKRGDLQRVQAVIVAWYREHHLPFIAVSLPEQDLSGGVLQAVVTEFRAGKITVVGNRWFTEDDIRRGLRLDPGDRIDSTRLDQDTAWLNENPFRTVNVVAQKSQTPGATDLELNTKDRFPVRFEAGFDNDGVPVIGRERWSAGITWGDAFWLGQQLSYRFTSSENFWLRPGDLPVRPGGATLAAHAVADTIPLPWRDRIVVFGEYEQVRPNIDPNFAQVGVNWLGGIRYIMPITLDGWPRQELQFGFDFKRTNNNLQFGGVQVSDSSTDVAQFVLAYGVMAKDRWGQTALSNRLVVSPGGLTPGSNDAAYQPSDDHIGVPYAKARYIYDNATLYRTTTLPFNLSWLAKVEGQIASTNLLDSERLAAGGADSVRGYDAYAANGSIGILSTQELRSPTFAPLKAVTGGAVTDQLQFDAFWDLAWVKNTRLIEGQPPSTTLASAGVGFRYTVGRYASIKLDYGWQLKKAPGEAHRGSRLQLAITIGN